MSETVDTPQLHLLDLTGQRVLVLGLGESGAGDGALGLRTGCAACAWPTRRADAARPARHCAAELPQATSAMPAARCARALLDDVDAARAGARACRRRIRQRRRWSRGARRPASPVVGEIELFARALADLQAESRLSPELIGGHRHQRQDHDHRAGRACCSKARAARAVAAGNISPTALDALRERSTPSTLPDTWVLELSSFQLAHDAIASARCRRDAERQRGPPRLAWLVRQPTSRPRRASSRPRTVQVLRPRRPGVRRAGDVARLRATRPLPVRSACRFRRRRAAGG